MNFVLNVNRLEAFNITMSQICLRFVRQCHLSAQTTKFHKLAPVFLSSIRRMSSTQYQFETLQVSQPSEYVTQVELNRPKKRNAMNLKFWGEMVECFTKLAQDEDCRVIVLTGAGPVYTSGIDLVEFTGLIPRDLDIARNVKSILQQARIMQDAFTVIEKCPKPVIAAINGACVGGGVDMVTACDVRWASQDAWFQVKEIELGLAADLGTLQRLPKVLGNDSLARELAFTARKLMVDEAKQCGLVSRIFPTKEALHTGALEMAAQIASKSPVAIQGTKVAMVYARDNTVANGLNQVLTWNQGMLQSEDTVKAIMALMQKEIPVFSKL